MNHFTLFAHGETFDVDAFLASSSLRPDHLWRRGEQRRYACLESIHETSGVEFELGNGLTVPFLAQEGIAVAYLRAHHVELRRLARFPGVTSFTLGLQYRTAFEQDAIGFCLGPSSTLMRHCLDIGCELTYYVSLDRLPDPDVEDEPDMNE